MSAYKIAIFYDFLDKINNGQTLSNKELNRFNYLKREYEKEITFREARPNKDF